jgi:ribosomal protein S6--L-glutamate ligase
MQLAIMVEQGHPTISYRGRAVSTLDAVIPRIGASISFFGTAVVRQFETLGVFSINSSHAISVSRDKLRSLQILSRHGIGIPPTVFVRDKNAVLPAIKRLGGAPVVIKLLEGTQGVGVILADHLNVAQAIIETLQASRQNVLIQKFVAESKGRDVRAFVVGGRVVAAMRRIASGDEFRSNLHRGGSSEPVTLEPAFERTALRAAQVLGLRVAGVDMLEGLDGPQVMEVNSSPGLEGIEATTKIDVASAIVQEIEDQVLFPDLDIKQRLTLKKGYGIAEFSIHRDSELCDKTLAESSLRDRDVTVLSITRNGVMMPNPRGSTRLLLGDLLLCYGKLLTLKGLMPKRRDSHAEPIPQSDSSPGEIDAEGGA